MSPLLPEGAICARPADTTGFDLAGAPVLDKTCPPSKAVSSRPSIGRGGAPGSVVYLEGKEENNQTQHAHMEA